MQKLLIKFNTTGSCIKGLKLLVSAPSDSVTILFNTWCVIIHTLSYIANLKYKLLRTPRDSSNEEPGNKITQTMEKRTILKEIVIMVMISDKVDIKANIQSVAQRNWRFV